MHLKPEMKALEFLIGKWNTKGAVKSDGKSPELKIHGTDTYEWTLDGHFILHKVDVMMGEERTQATEFIGEYDSKTKRYKMRSFDNQGGFLTTEAYIDKDDAFHILGDKMRSKLSMIDSNNLIAHWEKSEDNKSWASWMDLSLKK